MIPYYLITNVGTFVGSDFALKYPRHLILLRQLRAGGQAFLDRLAQMRRHTMPSIILDNGLAEGHVANTDEYMDAIKKTRPSCVVLPDLLDVSAAESRNHSLDFADRIRKECPNLLNEGMRMMFVPQGLNPHDNLACYAWALQRLDPTNFVIGIGLSWKLWQKQHPELDKETEAARELMFEQIMAIPSSSRYRFHVLGGRWGASHLYARYPNIVGLDSVKPCTCALNGMVYPHRPAIPKTEHENTLRCAPDALLEENVAAFAAAFRLVDFCPNVQSKSTRPRKR